MIDALVADGSFAIRAVTRDPHSGSARGEFSLSQLPSPSDRLFAALAAKGAEVVKADLSEPATLPAVYVWNPIDHYLSDRL